jgi:hypothetical protein
MAVSGVHRSCLGGRIAYFGLSRARRKAFRDGGTAALRHCGTAALQHYGTAALQHYGTAALQHYRHPRTNYTVLGFVDYEVDKIRIVKQSSRRYPKQTLGTTPTDGKELPQVLPLKIRRE